MRIPLGSWCGIVGLAFVGWVAGLCGQVAVAQEGADHVARLSYLAGDVTAARADNTGSDPGQLNGPLAEGTRLVTGDSGEAEIEFEDGSVLRLTPRTSVALTLLSGSASGGSGAGRVQTLVTVLYGLVYGELRVTDASVVAVSAGDDIVTPLSNAAVRVSFDQLPPAIADLTGTVRVEHAGAGEGSYQVVLDAGEQIEGDARDERTYTLSRSIPHDSWDDWNEERAEAALDVGGARTAARDAYAGTEGYGWSDLDSSGTWYSGAGQDLVWQPYEAASADFDPYGAGSWVFLSGPGYVWASGYAWGWTPYHCGSWSYSGGFGWGWSPSAGCGAGGWVRPGRFGASVSPVPPGWKRPLPPPTHGPLRPHPIVVAAGGPTPVAVTPPLRVPRAAQPTRLREGVALVALRPLAEPPVRRGESAVGAALRRDFPVNVATRMPIFGYSRPIGIQAPVGGGPGRPGSPGIASTALGRAGARPAGGSVVRSAGASVGGLRSPGVAAPEAGVLPAGSRRALRAGEAPAPARATPPVFGPATIVRPGSPAMPARTIEPVRLPPPAPVRSAPPAAPVRAAPASTPAAAAPKH